MGVLGKYLAREILGTLLPIWAALGLLLFVLEWLAQVFRVDTDPITALLLYAYKIPAHLQLSFPMAVLLSVLLVLTQLNKSREFVATQSLGVPPRRVFFWIVAGVLVSSGIQYWISDRVAPWGMRQHFEIEDVQIRKRPPRFSQVRLERIWYRNQDVLYNVRYLDPEKNELFDVTLYTFDDNFHLAQRIYAERAVWSGDSWLLKNGHVTVTDRRMSHPTSESFESRKTRLIEDPKTLKRGEFSAEVLSQSELLQTIRRYKKLGINTARWEVVFHSRMSLLLVAFVFLALAFPVATKFSRVASRAANISFAIGVSMAFWLIFNFSANAGAAGRIHPVLAAWAPSVLALVLVGVYLKTRTLKAQSE